MFVNRESFGGSKDYIQRLMEVYSRYKFPILIVTAVCEYVFFLFGTVFVFKKWHNLNIKKYFFLDRIHVPGILLSVAGVLLLLPLAEFTSRIFYNFFPEMNKFAEASNAMFVSKNIFELIFLIVLIGVTPAICEEFIFRGYFQRTLQRKLKEPVHYIISGFVFALFHQNTFGLLTLTIVGIYLGFIFYRFSSIYVSMSAHFVYNSAIVLSINSGIFKIFLNEKLEMKNEVIFISSILFVIVFLLMIFITRGKSRISEVN
jgi:membrane protease YdiL (CAAX protease family)